MAITREDGSLAEQGAFDAWGNVTEVRHFDTEGMLSSIDKTLGITDRGYTGHEHLQSVDLIHMNGRLYDPTLRRFLSPDNFVEDPFNTQNYNRYGYVLNNPLMFTDPTGEFLFTTAFLVTLGGKMILGVIIGLAINGIMNSIGGVPFFYGALKAAVVGAVSGALSAGIGVQVSAFSLEFARVC